MSTPEALLFEIDARGIVYCHWKSNSHLDAALAGITDLDLLFDGRQINSVHAVLAERGYKRFVTHPSRSYPGVEDFLSVHPNTGSLVHLHVHYRLLTGQRHMKNYRLPWEGRVLGTRAKDPSGVFTTDPNHELFLLVVRAAMKIRWRDRLKVLARSQPIAAEIREEFDWLTARADRDFVPKIAEDLLGGPCADSVADSLDSGLGFRDLLKLSQRLKAALKDQRAYGTFMAALLRSQREIRWALGSLNRKTLQGPFPYARTPASGGLIVAVVGGDGSGKSTVIRELYGWLERKVDVMPVYFGSGKGKGSLLRLPLQVARALLRPSGRSANRAGSSPPGERKPSFYHVVWGLVLAREKKLKLRKALRARERGFIVICDRYPQTQTPGLIDGPLLSAWLQSESPIRRRLARWESAPYAFAGEIGPDIVFRLDVSGPTAASRRPEASRGSLDVRREVLERLTFDEARHGVHLIDAERDLSSVLLEVKQKLWRVL